MIIATFDHCFEIDAAGPYWGPKSVMSLTVFSLTLLATLAQIAHSQAADPSECMVILSDRPGGFTDPGKSSSPMQSDRDI